MIILPFIVALSRVKSLSGVSLKSMIQPQKIACDPLVVEYYCSQFERKENKTAV